MRKLYSYKGLKCSVQDCDDDAKENFMCCRHAQRVRRYGDPNYLTPEQTRRANNRLAQPMLRKAKATSYLKLHGRHEHRRVAESMLGRPLKRGEIVHHKDGDKHNNSPENLEVMTQSEHIKAHRAEMIAAAERKKNASA